MPVTGGTKRTLDFANKHGSPVLVLALDGRGPIDSLRGWLDSVRPIVLNIAGQMKQIPRIHAFAFETLIAVLDAT